MDTPRISVIISTFNRYELLKKAIDSLFHQTCPADFFEIIIVDNNSTDPTPDIQRKSFPDAPALRYFKEEKQGISPARNLGGQKALGEIIAFLDDDAAADPDWLESLYGVYQKFPDASIAGGKIIPVWPGEKPGWLTENLEKNYGALDLGNSIVRIHFPVTPFGGNISIKRELFLELGGFHEHLGRGSSGLLSGEEVNLCFLAEQNNKEIYYTPHAVIHHHTPLEKLTRRYLLKRTYYQGISNMVLKNINGETDNLFVFDFLLKLKNKTKNLIRDLLYGKISSLTEDLAGTCRILGSLRQLLSIKMRKRSVSDKRGV